MRTEAITACGCIMLFCSAALLLTGCREQILHDLDELRANRISVVLSRAGIEAKKIREGNHWGLEVPGGQVRAALRALEMSRAAKPPVSDEKEPASIIPSREERLRQIERSVAQSLEATLERLPGVLEAHVHLHVPAQRPGLEEERKEGSAGVLAIWNGSDTLKQEDIKQLVGSAAGVKPQAVTVVLVEERPKEPPASRSVVEEMRRPSVGTLLAGAQRCWPVLAGAAAAALAAWTAWGRKHRPTAGTNCGDALLAPPGRRRKTVEEQAV